jgi:hypothetical protein
MPIPLIRWNRLLAVIRVSEGINSSNIGASGNNCRTGIREKFTMLLMEGEGVDIVHGNETPASTTRENAIT